MNDAVRIWFEDNGIGVAEQDRDRIFRIFERVHPATLYEGTGIGLAIVRKTIERMGGTIGIESSPNSGSRFWIQLPSGGEDPTGHDSGLRVAFIERK
jgi:signal transduction histidine kinase